MRSRTDAESYIRAETDSRGKLSQRARILQLLLSAPEITLPAILDLRISQFGSRIKELRGAGFDIRNRTERMDGIVRSWYRLVPDPPVDPLPEYQLGPLFGASRP